MFDDGFHSVHRKECRFPPGSTRHSFGNQTTFTAMKVGPEDGPGQYLSRSIAIAESYASSRREIRPEQSAAFFTKPADSLWL